MTEQERTEALNRYVAAATGQGWRVVTQSPTSAQLVKGKRPSHLLHFFVGLLTLTLWWFFVWLPICIFGGEKHRYVQITETGNVVTS